MTGFVPNAATCALCRIYCKIMSAHCNLGKYKVFTSGDQAPGRRRFGFHARPTQGGGHFILKTLPFPFPAFHSGKDNSMLCQTLPSVRSQNDFKLWAVIAG